MNRLLCLLFSFVMVLNTMAQHREDRFHTDQSQPVSHVVKSDASVEKQHPVSALDSLEVSLMTCSPGTEAYTMFGHTALRVINRKDSVFDFTFNYGMFNYSSKNFIYRFVKGETDYELGVEPTASFLSRYAERGFIVYEQVLRLNTTQKAKLLSLLLENYRPENRVYRYNFLYDNCTTRAKKIIINSLGDSSLDWNMYPVFPLNATYRDMLHQYTKAEPWTEFGIDMVLGSEVDRTLDAVNCNFLPLTLKQIADSTLVHFPRPEIATGTRGTQYFVKQKIEYDPKRPMEREPDFPLSPMAFFTTLLIVALVISGWNLYTGKTSCWFDVILYLAQGLAGVVVAFLFFFSEHPAVGSNWLVLTFNPLALLLIPNVIFHYHSKKGPLIPFFGVDLLECVNLACLLITVYIYFAPTQWMNPAMLPLVLTLLLRSLLHFVQHVRFLYFQNKKEAELSWKRR